MHHASNNSSRHIVFFRPFTLAMARLRIRHPNGIAQCEIDLDGSTVLDLQQKIEAETKILPSRQVCACASAPL
jgi:hypothetical protein